MSLSFDRSAALIAEAAQTVAGGVNSNFRIGMAGGPLVFKRGEGPYLQDVNDNWLIDYYCGMGAMVLGHTPPTVRQAGDPSTSARLLFKDSDGRVLETYISKPIASSEFTAVVVSAYPAPNTATVSVDVGGGGQAVIALKNAVLVEHPVLLLQEEVTDKHGVDPGRVKAAHSVAGSTH